jgi:hypothetical protein
MAAGQPLRVRSTNHGRSQTCHSRPTHAARAAIRSVVLENGLIGLYAARNVVSVSNSAPLNVDLEHVDESVAWKIRHVRRDKGAERGRLTIQLHEHIEGIVFRRILGAVSAMST